MSEELLEELGLLSKGTGNNKRHKILDIFHDRPEVLEAIKKARHEQGATMESLAEVINRHSDTKISASSIRNWLVSEGCWDVR